MKFFFVLYLIYVFVIVTVGWFKIATFSKSRGYRTFSRALYGKNTFARKNFLIQSRFLFAQGVQKFTPPDSDHLGIPLVNVTNRRHSRNPVARCTKIMAENDRSTEFVYPYMTIKKHPGNFCLPNSIVDSR